MYKICFYVPPSHAEEVKNALFASGAGKIGNYGCCAWQVLGEGQFMPLTGSHAFIGEENKLEKISEYKIEMICNDAIIRDVIVALKKAHPYEEPAYQVWRVEEII
jgi:structural toxin protein (hemagglutinin/hemolysin) RtxA